MPARWTTIPVAGGKWRKVLVNRLHNTNVFVAENTQPKGVIFIPTRRGGALVFQQVKDLDTAIRQHEHILERYGLIPGIPGEVQELKRVQEAVEEAHRIVRQWSKTRLLDARQRKALAAELEKAAAPLMNAINAYKEEALDYLLDASALEDRLGRKNPVVACVKLITAKTRLLERLEEIGVIHPAIALRRQALLAEKKRVQRIVEEAKKHSWLIREKTRAFNMPEEATESELAGINARLRMLTASLNTIRVNPYRAPAQLMIRNMKNAVAFVNARKINAAKEALRQVEENAPVVS